jgi:hypothetical protein
MSSRQPKDCEPKVRPKLQQLGYHDLVTTGYFGDLAVTGCLAYYYEGRTGLQFPPGPHVRIGPPSAAGTGGMAAAIYVPTSPTIRTAILIARFMVGLLTCYRATVPWGKGFVARIRIIRHLSICTY